MLLVVRPGAPSSVLAPLTLSNQKPTGAFLHPASDVLILDLVNVINTNDARPSHSRPDGALCVVCVTCVSGQSGPGRLGEMLLPPFLVVRDAGHAPVNGRYIPDGTLSGKPKYKQVWDVAGKRPP